jgi:SAM-dependent methyltransferase
VYRRRLAQRRDAELLYTAKLAGLLLGASASSISCGSVEAQQPKDVVRRGYDTVSRRYDRWSGGETKYSAWLSELGQRIPAGGAVLDLGCGSGLPVARDLTAAGCEFTGVDISEVQIRRARELVPEAAFLQADISCVDFGSESFDAVVSFFALIHLPLDDQLPLLRRIAGWLRPGGLFVATTGYWAWTGYEENWLDGGAPMWWSHADVTTYRSWIDQAGMSIDREDFVPEEDGGHALFWTSRPQRPDRSAPAPDAQASARKRDQGS